VIELATFLLAVVFFPVLLDSRPDSGTTTFRRCCTQRNLPLCLPPSSIRATVEPTDLLLRLLCYTHSDGPTMPL